MWQRLKAHLTAAPCARTLAVLDWYAFLDIRYDLSDNQVGRGFFSTNPEHYARWIQIYFANPAIFTGRMQLRFFLENHPAELFKNLLANQRPPLGRLVVAQHEQ